MLNAISNLSSEMAADALSDLMGSLLPSPIDERSSLDETQQAILAELRTRLKLSPQDESKKAMSRILDALSEELRSILWVKDAEAVTKVRLAHRNELPPAALRCVYGEVFKHRMEPLGADRSQVEAALRRPDSYQFDPVPQLADETRASSLLLLNRSFDSHQGEFTLLVEARRVADTLTIQSVWRAYHDDVHMPDTKDPLASLRAFVEVFGIEFRSPTTYELVKFVEYDVVRADGPRRTYVEMIESLPQKPGFPWQTHELYAQSKVAGMQKVGLAYVIDVHRYKIALRDRGVRVRMP